jgi:pimeloyl-ACP methyl ester carboxylesterase
VVLLQGFDEPVDLRRRLGKALTDSGIELWAFAEVGDGLSPGDGDVTGSVDELVENGRRLAALAEGADPDSPLFLAGHSLGGVAAAVTASRDAVAYEGLIVSGAPLPPSDRVGYGRDGTQTPAAGAPWLDDLLGPAWAELDRSFEHVALPVLFAHGREDTVSPVGDARAWADRVPDGRIVELADAHHGRLDEVAYRGLAAALVEFVTRVSEPVGAFSTHHLAGRSSRGGLAIAR